MDLLQSAIRTLYYDVSIEKLIQEVKQGCCTFLKRDFASLTAWTNQAFTRSELALLQTFVLQKTACGANPKWHQLFLLLNEFSNRCLTYDADSFPLVKFKELLYWRNIAILLGEDVLTTSFLAYNAVKTKEISAFDWPNVIGHNEQTINQALDDGICDVHAHLKASADIFELTWLDFMNRVLNRDEDYRGVQYLADITLQSYRDEKMSSFKKMVQVAAILRMLLYEYSHGKSPGNVTDFVKEIIDDDKRRTSYLIDLQSMIAVYKKANNSEYDYANSKPLSANIYSIHQGERDLLYHFFRRYYSEDSDTVKLADLFFLYISLKIRIRKEFVQTNPLYGFENFKIYESRKEKYCDNYKKLYPLYAVQSSIRIKSTDGYEARVTYNGIPSENLDVAIDQKTTRGEINNHSLSYVIHLIKKNERIVHIKNFGMRYDFKEIYVKNIQTILWEIEKRNHAENTCKIVGIDAAGEEIECSPAVFGHIYRYARLCGMQNFTYHVGEDFFDIADGLKNIDDAVRFLDLKKGNRLGHAIALGVNAYAYYEKREFQVIMPKQKLLDVFVWIRQTCKQAGIDIPQVLNSVLLEKSIGLYQDIGYKALFDEVSYYQSMLLRSDDSVEVVKSKWDKSSLCQDERCVCARNNSDARNICIQFMTNKVIWENGNKVDLFCYPSEICAIIEKLQNYIMAVIAKKGIAIESNPSSNIKIGPIDDYCNHPVFRFMANGLNVSINTDDKGIFATSLPNEYSLVANAFYQNGHTIAESALLIERLKEQAWMQRFKKEMVSII